MKRLIFALFAYIILFFGLWSLLLASRAAVRPDRKKRKPFYLPGGTAVTSFVVSGG